MANITYDKPSFLMAVEPGIKAIVAQELSHIIDKVMEDVRKEVEASFADAVQLTVEKALEAMGSQDLNITVDLRVKENI